MNRKRSMMCSSNSNSTYVDEADDDDDDDDSSSMMTRMFMSRLSIENFDADEEISDDHDDKDRNMLGSAGNFLSLDSEPSERYSSLPATPTPRQRRRRRRRNQQQQLLLIKDVDYASESEAQKMIMKKNMRRSRRVARERRWLERAAVCNWDDHTTANCSSSNKKKGMDHEHNYSTNITTTCDEKYMKHYHNMSESEGHAGGGDPPTVITRPKGGKRYLCMDLEEVKACRELGFELDHHHHHHHHHHHMLDVMLTTSSTTLDTSSGGNSPVANWRISSPGDDPRDVKARLKLWAQAVALVSTSTSRRTL